MGVFKGGGFNPPPKFSDFYLKSEGKEVEKKMKGMGVGCKLLRYFLGLRYFQGGVENFFRGWVKIFRGGGGLRNFRGGGGLRNFREGGGVEKFLWGVEKFPCG